MSKRDKIALKKDSLHLVFQAAEIISLNKKISKVKKGNQHLDFQVLKIISNNLNNNNLNNQDLIFFSRITNRKNRIQVIKVFKFQVMDNHKIKTIKKYKYKKTIQKNNKKEMHLDSCNLIKRKKKPNKIMLLDL